jgi:hypothetical protein
LRSSNRPGIEKLIDWLINETDFFTAPASTRFHGAVEGGLLAHSLAVYEHLVYVTDGYFDEVSGESLILVALLHDICKANFYTVSMRNAKNETTGQWEKVPYYAIDDQIPLGHGEKSVILLQQFITLTMDEIMAIRWHMGLTDTDYSTRQALNGAFGKYPLAVALHMADMAASYFEGK